MAETSLLLLILCLTTMVIFMWLTEVRLLLFLILVEFSLLIMVLGIFPTLSLGGESVLLFVMSGSVLSLLLLILSSSARKFGIYASEV